jgi:hypothetical protein
MFELRDAERLAVDHKDIDRDLSRHQGFEVLHLIAEVLLGGCEQGKLEGALRIN